MSDEIIDHINTYQLQEKFQSGFRKNLSVESALLRVLNDIYLRLANKEIIALCLIDLSATFDTIDHDILFDFMRNNLKITGLALELVNSFLRDRSQRVRIGDDESDPGDLKYGVPQGTLLRPLIFSLYVIPLYNIFKENGTPFHAYADDTQFLISYDDLDDLEVKLSDILRKVANWLDAKKLKINTEKTEIITFGPNALKDRTIKYENLELKTTNLVRNLGVYVDSGLNLDAHINRVTRACFGELKAISRNRETLSDHACIVLINTNVFSRGFGYYMRLQAAQNFNSQKILVFTWNKTVFLV